MFDSELHGHVIPNISLEDTMFYIDLDTVIVGNIDKILQASKDFIVLSDPYRYNTPNIGSGLMSWKFGTLNYLNKNFTGIAGYSGGDQHYIKDNSKEEMSRWQDLFPGEILSYKVDLPKNKQLPSEAKIIYFHGIPNPHQVTEIDWMKKCWI
jgi:hypothetical protein